MRFPFRPIAAVSIASVGLASVTIHPFGNVKGAPSCELQLASAPADRAILQIFEKSCQSCHSQNTVWPWYSYVAPASWMIEKDVQEGRSQMNLSRWNEYPVEQKAELLAAIGVAVKNRVMPLPRYILLHPEAELSNAEAERVYQWTKSERRRLKSSGTPAMQPQVIGGN